MILVVFSKNTKPTKPALIYAKYAEIKAAILRMLSVLSNRWDCL